MNRHYNKITFQTAMYHVGGFQKIRIQRQDKGYLLDVLFQGRHRDLENKENKNLRDSLEYKELGTLKADGDLLVIGVRDY